MRLRIKPPLSSLQALIRHININNTFLTLTQRSLLSTIVLLLILMLAQINPWPVTLISSFLTLIAIRAYTKGQDLRLLRRRKLLLGICALIVWIIIFVQFRTVIGHQAGIAAITILVTLKLFELDRRRDGLLLMFLSQILIIGLFFVSQNIQSAFFALLMELMLITGQSIIFMPTHTPLREHFSLLKNSAKLIFLGLIFGIVLFIIFPRPTEPILSMGLPKNQSVSGLSETMSPGSIDSLVLSSNIAFQVEFNNQQIPSQTERYWRGPSMTHYNRGTWRAMYQASSPPPLLAENWRSLYRKKTGKSPWDYQLMIEPSFRTWVYGLETTVAMSPQGHVRPDGLWETKQPITTRKVFTMTSIASNQSTLHSFMRKHLLEKSNIDGYREPRLQQLAEQWREEALQAYPLSSKAVSPSKELPSKVSNAIVDKALQYFRQQPFIYTLKPPKLPSSNPMDAFLFDVRQGFCESYASSFTLLMRSAGIPARVVTGYQGGTINATFDIMTIRQSDAHAWSEVWIEEEGWRRVDPTAAVAPERIERSLSEAIDNVGSLGLLSQASNSSMLRQAMLFWEGAQTKWQRLVVQYNKDSQSSLLSKLSLQWLTPRHLIYIATGIVLFFLVLVYWRLQPQRSTLTLERQWWHKIINRLQKRGHAVDLTMPPHEVYKVVAQHPFSKKPSHLATLKVFIDDFIRLKYINIKLKEREILYRRLKKNMRKI